MEVANLIDAFIKDLSIAAIPFLTAMASIGVVSMGLMQTIKNLSNWRMRFQRRFVENWLNENSREAPKDAPDGKKFGEINVAQAEKDLVKLTTDGDYAAFYGLEIEKLCGQVNAATQALFDFPARHVDLIRCLASQANPADLEELLPVPGQDRSHPSYKSIRERVAVLQQSDPNDSNAAAAIGNLNEARARVIRQVQRSIDGLQISAGASWKWLLQWWTFGLSVVLTLFGLIYENGSGVPSGGSMMVFFFTAVMAGFIAPVARDLVAALEKARE